MNISSAIIHTRASGMEHLRGQLETIAGVEVHAASAEGRFIVSIESAGDQDTADTFETIQRLDGVMSASLVYSHFESDPDQEV
ncbi:MAG: chaperone NapD [Sulfuritalea sp.]|jgi:nitrate reductase NapD|nr:chaperone NapD [Sulfuritalea sp.]